MAIDHVYINGQILTMDPNGTIASAFGIAGSRFCSAFGKSLCCCPS